MNDFLRFAEKIISWNCSTLSVPFPKVIRIANASEFISASLKCAVSSDGNELLINKDFAESNVDTLFIWLTLSHECRHIWQIQNREDLFKQYEQSSSLSVQEYNAQAAEIDAWAWAIIVVGNLFGVRPTFEENFGAELWAQIQERAREIVAEDFF